MKLFKSQMHPRATYETLVEDTILNPEDKINLPNRAATQLRSTQQLSRWDDQDFLGLSKDNERIVREQIHQYEFTKMTGESSDKNTTRGTGDPTTKTSAG